MQKQFIDWGIYSWQIFCHYTSLGSRFRRRSATVLYILYTVGGVGAKRTARPNMTVQSTESNLIWMKFGTWEFTSSLIANLTPPPPPPTYIKVQKLKIADNHPHFGCFINFL